MVDRRRFTDSLPTELDPLTDSDWSKLSEDQRSDYLRRHAIALLDRHLALMDGQAGLGLKLDAQTRRLTENVERTKGIEIRLNEHGDLLRKNTETTETSAAKLDLLIERSAPTLKFADDVAGAGRLVGRATTLGKAVAWVVFPAGALWAAVVAGKAWLLARGVWPW